MRNRLAILSVLLFAGNVFFTTAYSQIKKSYEFDFKEDILWLTNKEFKIFVSTKKGVYTLNNVQEIYINAPLTDLGINDVLNKINNSEGVRSVQKEIILKIANCAVRRSPWPLQ